jgi:hypothetical protein
LEGNIRRRAVSISWVGPARALGLHGGENASHGDARSSGGRSHARTAARRLICSASSSPLEEAQKKSPRGGRPSQPPKDLRRLTGAAPPPPLLTHLLLQPPRRREGAARFLSSLRRARRQIPPVVPSVSALLLPLPPSIFSDCSARSPELSVASARAVLFLDICWRRHFGQCFTPPY